MLNLWAPHAGLPVGLVIVTAFILGMLHGVTPDEHTWPITFSYAVGSYSSRGGAKNGLLFSLAFTLQRAIASELAFVALAAFLRHLAGEFIVYIVVGLVMAVSGAYILRVGRHLRALAFLERLVGHQEGDEDLSSMPSYMPLVHGFVAGWGTGAFALIVYTVLAPSMPSAVWGWVPGFAFGLGTTLLQVLIGAAVGGFMARRRLGADARARVGKQVAGHTLLYGGLAFAAAGLVGLFVPALGQISINTGLKVHNLHQLGIGFFLVVVVVVVIAGASFMQAMRRVQSEAADAAWAAKRPQP